MRFRLVSLLLILILVLTACGEPAYPAPGHGGAGAEGAPATEDEPAPAGGDETGQATVELTPTAESEPAPAAGEVPAIASVTGTVTYSGEAAPPAGAVLSVQIEDVSRADAPAVVIGEQTVSDLASPPYSFEVIYVPAVIEESGSYALRVRITDAAGALLFTNTASVPVITHGSPTANIEVVVDPA